MRVPRRARPSTRGSRTTLECASTSRIPPFDEIWLLARVSRGPDLCHDLIQVPALRGLNGRELPVAPELLEPQQLADGQHVPVVQVGRDGRGERAHRPAACLFLIAPTRLE